MADNKAIQNKAESPDHNTKQDNAYATSSCDEFEVVKEYAGIKVGEIKISKDRSEIAHMVKQGYWKAK